MQTDIHRIPLGMTNCYLIREEGAVLVDGGFPGKGEEFEKQLEALSIEPRGVGLLFATHGHSDHVGSVSEIRELTGCEVAVNRREKDWLEQGRAPLPPGITPWGKIFGALVKMAAPLLNFSAASVDLALGDEGLSLESYGIHGTVLHTPGHSSGSMSLLLDSGETFVGCVAMNGLPYRVGPGMPCFGDDLAALKESWRLLLDRGAKRIYPAHGMPFAAEVLSTLL